MKTASALFCLVSALGVLVTAPAARASDTDGGDDCPRPVIEDWGDAPEGLLAYPGVIGKFPTCRSSNTFGTQETPAGCTPLSTPPGPTGHIFHRQGLALGGPGYWFGCPLFPQVTGGIDSDAEGKVNEPPQGSSFCSGGVQTDCITAAYGLAWDQDECYGGSDAGLQNPPSLVTCGSATITFSTSNCLLQARPVFLNIVIDMNHDGDWNDAQLCGPGVCAYEWAVKNATIVLPPGCGTITSPSFLVGPTPGPSWLRISMTDSPVTNDYPWVGGAGLSGFTGGETEDYPAFIENAVATEPSTWGRLKSMHR